MPTSGRLAARAYPDATMSNRTLSALLSSSLLLSACDYTRYTGTTYPLPELPPEQRLDRTLKMTTSWEQYLQSPEHPYYAYAQERHAKQLQFVTPLLTEQPSPDAPPLYVEMEAVNYARDVPPLAVVNGFVSAMTAMVVPWRMSFKGGARMTVKDDHRVLYQAETVGKQVTTLWIGYIGKNSRTQRKEAIDAYSVHTKAIAEQMQAEYQKFTQAQAAASADSLEGFLKQANWYRYPALRELAGMGMGMEARNRIAFYDSLMSRYSDIAPLLPATYRLGARGPQGAKLRELVSAARRGESSDALNRRVIASGADYGDFSNDEITLLIQNGMPQALLGTVIEQSLRIRQARAEAQQRYEQQLAIERQQRRAQEEQEEREYEAMRAEQEASGRAAIMQAFAEVQQGFEQMGRDMEASRVETQSVLNEYHASRQRDQEMALTAQAEQARRERESRAAQQQYDQSRAQASAQIAAALDAAEAQRQREAGIRAYQDAQAATAAKRTSSPALTSTAPAASAAASSSTWPEGITVCKPAPGSAAGEDLHCSGPFSTGVIESLERRVRVACGSASDRGDGIREYAAQGTMRIFGCGFGINPAKAQTNTWHTDQVQRQGLGSVSGRRSYRCPSTQLDPCFSR